MIITCKAINLSKPFWNGRKIRQFWGSWTKSWRMVHWIFRFISVCQQLFDDLKAILGLRSPACTRIILLDYPPPELFIGLVRLNPWLSEFIFMILCGLFLCSGQSAWQTLVAYEACTRLCLQAWARGCMEAPEFLRDECIALRNAFGYVPNENF